MTDNGIPAEDNYQRHRVSVLDSEIAYVDVGTGDPTVFLHGNPTSSYLWRNVIPHVEDVARCLAPDMVGMGQSGRSGNSSYRLVDHVRYLDAWFDALDLTQNVTLVCQDWGSAIAFHWAYRNPARVKGIAYMEAIVRPLTWEEFPEAAHSRFQSIRSPSGEELVLEQNMFVEGALLGNTIRDLTDEEMEVYRRPYVEAGESRRPTLTWPRELPIGGEPADVVEIVDTYSGWLASSEVPKLFISADPGDILIGAQREFCQTWPNQKEVTVAGIHWVQEDSPAEIGQAIVSWYSGL